MRELTIVPIHSSLSSLNYFLAVECFNYFDEIAKMPLRAPKDFGAVAKKALGAPKGSCLVSFGAIARKVLSALKSFGAIDTTILNIDPLITILIIRKYCEL